MSGRWAGRKGHDQRCKMPAPHAISPQAWRVFCYDSPQHITARPPYPSMRPQIFGRALAGAQTCFLPTRSLSCSAITRSGHNRWSKIKHDKGKEDAIKSKARGFLSEDVTMASRCA